jgi:DNA-binding NtrC family response regulator
MATPSETLDRSGLMDLRDGGCPPSEPGLLLVFAAGRPASRVIRFTDGEVALGRDLPAFGEQPDGRMSRRHALVRWTGHRFEVTDLGSRNGTSADGVALPPEVPTELTRVLRAGDSLFVPVRDVEPFLRLGVRLVGSRVEGPTLQEVLRSAEHAARLGTTLHITGESGSGKEGLARAFHAAAPSGAGGPFQAVNCATIPEGVAERLLFGAKRGAYSGADADADGYIQAAHGGTLFLDEVGELAPAVQAKLLRVLETGEVLPLGASRPRRVELRFCSATHRDLRALVTAGRLREDLYFRIAAPRVVVPPLRERPEEIAYLVHAEAERVSPPPAVHASLIEACLLRVWPGNVRELTSEVRSAVQAALAAQSQRLEVKHLSPLAGSALAALPPESASESPTERGAPETPGGGLPPGKARIAGALKRHEGNVSGAARELGVHRTQLRRWMERYGLEASVFAPKGRPPPEDD